MVYVYMYILYNRHSTQKAICLAHVNMHTNHSLAQSGCHYCKQEVTGIHGKWEQERERNMGTGTYKYHCYLSDSSPVRFTKL